MAEPRDRLTTQPCLFPQPDPSPIAIEILITYFTNRDTLKIPYNRNQDVIDLLYIYTATPTHSQRLVTAIENFHATLMQQELTPEEKKHHLHRLCDAYFVFEKKEDQTQKNAFDELIHNWVNANKQNKRDLKKAIPEIYGESQPAHSTVSCTA